MKKLSMLKKLFAVLCMSSFVVMTFVSCADLLSGLANNGTKNGNGTETEKEKEKEDTNSTEEKKSIYNFKATQKSGSYLYFTSTETFEYTSKTDNKKYTGCIYQICFNSKNSANTKGSWVVYSRPKASTQTIEIVAKGDFEGNPYEAGSIKLTYEAGDSAGTVTVSGEAVKKNLEWDYTGLTFSMDVTKLHSTIGAVDEK